MFTARAATLSTVSVVAVSLGLAALTGASAAEQRGTTPDFRGPVLISGVCSGKAAYHGSVRQDGDSIVLTVQFHRAGERTRWNLTTEATTYFGDETAVTGIGDFGTAHSDAAGKMTARLATPLGVRHELKVHLSRPQSGERCYIRVMA